MSFSTSKIRKLTANMGILAVGEICTKVFTLFAFVKLANHYGRAGNGNLEFALNVLFMLTLIIDFGLGLHGARDIARDPNKAHQIVQRVVTLRFWLVLFSLLLLSGMTMT